MNQSLKLPREWLRISKADLLSARCLYRNRHYSQSIFYLQQSVEKLAKALILLDDKKTESDLRSISHSTLSEYEKNLHEEKQKRLRALENPAIMKSLSVLGNSKKQLKQQVRSLDRLLNIMRATKEEKQFTEKDVNLRIVLEEHIQLKREMNKGINQLIRKRKELRHRELKDNAEKIKKLWLKAFLHFKQVNPRGYEEMEKGVNALDAKLLKEMFPILEIQFILTDVANTSMLLSLITHGQVNLTRYPQGELSPLKIYAAKHLLIRNFKLIAYIQNKNISNFEKFFVKIRDS